MDPDEVAGEASVTPDEAAGAARRERRRQKRLEKQLAERHAMADAWVEKQLRVNPPNWDRVDWQRLGEIFGMDFTPRPHPTPPRRRGLKPPDADGSARGT